MRGQMHGTRLQGSLALVARSVCRCVYGRCSVSLATQAGVLTRPIHIPTCRAFPTMLRAVGAKHDIRLICTDGECQCAGLLMHDKLRLSQHVGAITQSGCLSPIAVDGTLLDSKQQLSPRVEAAVHAAAACGVPVSYATKWSMSPALAQTALCFCSSGKLLLSCAGCR